MNSTNSTPKHTSSDELNKHIGGIISGCFNLENGTREDVMKEITPHIEAIYAFIKTNYIPKELKQSLDNLQMGCDRKTLETISALCRGGEEAESSIRSIQNYVYNKLKMYESLNLEGENK